MINDIGQLSHIFWFPIEPKNIKRYIRLGNLNEVWRL